MGYTLLGVYSGYVVIRYDDTWQIEVMPLNAFIAAAAQAAGVQ